MKTRIKEIINELNLMPHPEGGYFIETYRSDGTIKEDSLNKTYNGERNYSTCIYFLLTSNTFSAFHKIRQDEIWHFYEGSPIELFTISVNGNLSKHIIGLDLKNGQKPQLIVPGNHWFAASVLNKDSYALVGCTVSPGFDFEDFVLGTKKELVEKFPQHEEIIAKYTNE